MIREVLIQAQQIGMMSEEYYYLLTSIDAHTVDLHRFKVKSRVKKVVEGHLNPGLFKPKLQPRTFQPHTFQP